MKENACRILSGDYPDPSIVCDKGVFYMTHSSFNYAPGLLIWRSADLRSWTPLVHALRDYDGDVWAPDIVKCNGRFFIYYYTHPQGLKVVHADFAEGPWSEPVLLLGPTKLIDPGHVVTADGIRWLHVARGYAVPLSDDGLSVIGDPVSVYRGWDIPVDWRVEALALEGPKLFWRNGWCYMATAIGGTAQVSTSHMVMVARSRNGVDSWENDPSGPMLRTASREEAWWSRGHGTIFNAGSDRWFCVYHAYSKGFHTLGRQTLLEPVRWTEDGWPRRQSAETMQVAPPALLIHSDSFDSVVPDIQWRAWAANVHGIAETGGGMLRLKASEEGSIVASITGDERYAVEIELSECPPEIRAGLLLFYSPSAFHGIAFRGGKVLKVKAAGSIRREVRMGTADLPIRFRIVNDANEVDFYWKGAGDAAWSKLYFSSEMSGFNNNVFGGYFSLRPAVSAAGSGSAVFRDFIYGSAEAPQPAQWMDSEDQFSL